MHLPHHIVTILVTTLTTVVLANYSANVNITKSEGLRNVHARSNSSCANNCGTSCDGFANRRTMFNNANGGTDVRLGNAVANASNANEVLIAGNDSAGQPIPTAGNGVSRACGIANADFCVCIANSRFANAIGLASGRR